MIKLIKNIQLYAPEKLGLRDILIVDGKVQGIYEDLTLPESVIPTEIVDGGGKMALPGFIDGHVHILGGGGEGGFSTRTPELMLSDAVLGGVTTIVGCLGTDGVCRDLRALVAKARGLDEEGITCYCYTGSYEIPVVTITGTVRSDVMLIDKMIGAGEIALADHRSAMMPDNTYENVIAQARVGGMLSGKAGVVNIHLGTGLRAFDILEEIFERTELPITQVLPTHAARTPELRARAFEFAKKGGNIDFTTSGERRATGTTAGRSLRCAIDAGVDPSHITFSSDGQGSLPRFDKKGTYLGLGVGSVQSLYAQVVEAVKEWGVPMETALQAITSNPARIFKLPAKGCIKPQADADLVLVDAETLAVADVLAKGRWLMRDGKVLVKGTFE